MTNKDAAIRIVLMLREAGYDALLAGGCVRDMLLGREAKDYDVATSAHPQEVGRLFQRSLMVGAKFGVVIVLLGGQQVEVATFRTESGYADGRHPDEVRFSCAEEDAARRDFTINGMFYDPQRDEVIDYVGGREDLAAGILRTIGDAGERFGEDYLRVLRAVRFATQLGFQIDAGTWEAVRRAAGRIMAVSAERIAIELEATITHPNRGRGARLLIESGLAAAIFPEVETTAWQDGAVVLPQLRGDVTFALALAGLFVRCSAEQVEEICLGLKLSTNQVRHAAWLARNREALRDGYMAVARLKTLAANPYFRDLFELERAVCRVEGRSTAALAKVRRRLRAMAGQELQPQPLLDGHEIMAMGLPQGPLVGHLARELYFAQLEGEVSSAEEARQWAREWLARHEEITD